MAFVVNGVVRYVIHGNQDGRQIANMVDMKLDTTGSLANRNDAVAEQGGIILKQWKNDVMAQLSSTYNFTSVSWVDLDSANGVTGLVTSSGGVTLPAAGSNAGAPASSNVAVLVKKVTTSGRGIRAGRMYLPAFSESDTATTAPNVIQLGAIGLWQSKMTSFLGNINQAGGLPLATQWTTNMVVVHITSREAPKPGQKYGNPLTGSSSKVTALSVDSRLATQRRRLRG